MAAEDDIRATSIRFYSALNRMLNGETASMIEIWAHDPTVTTMHPIGDRQVGWDKVRQSWEQFAGIATGGEVRLRDQLITVAGEVAWERGVERGQVDLAGERLTVEQRVTNIYHRRPDGWKIVHHHSDPSPEMQSVLNRLSGGR